MKILRGKLNSNSNYLIRFRLVIAIALLVTANFINPYRVFGKTKQESKNSSQSASKKNSVNLTITLKHNDEREKQTETQLRRLLSTYDVSKWIFTKNIIIESGAIPHSHPILTINTRYLKDDELLLSAFIHEQLHRFVEQNSEKSQSAFKDLKEIFPKTPIGFPEGSTDEEGNYEHLLVCYLEYQADRGIFGELKARQIIDFLARDHYTWIYQTVLEQGGKIASVIRKNKLFLPDKAAVQVKKESEKTTNNVSTKDSVELQITLKHGDEKEKWTEKQLKQMLSSYDASKFIYTKNIIIDSDDNIVSHSHPVLTLDTGGAKDDELVLSTFIHEQFHWFLLTKPKELEEAMNELKTLYPKVPVSYPEGAINEESSYNHLLVCYLEYQADKTLFGELKAWEMLNYLTHSHYRWIYRTILDEQNKIAAVIKKNTLMATSG